MLEDATAIGKSATPRTTTTVATHHQPAVPGLPTSPLTGIHAAIASSDPANHGHYAPTIATLSMMPARENISNPSVMVKISGDPSVMVKVSGAVKQHKISANPMVPTVGQVPMANHKGVPMAPRIGQSRVPTNPLVAKLKAKLKAPNQNLGALAQNLNGLGAFVQQSPTVSALGVSALLAEPMVHIALQGTVCPSSALQKCEPTTKPL
jgi:hypothetical protein